MGIIGKIIAYEQASMAQNNTKLFQLYKFPIVIEKNTSKKPLKIDGKILETKKEPY